MPQFVNEPCSGPSDPHPGSEIHKVAAVMLHERRYYMNPGWGLFLHMYLGKSCPATVDLCTWLVSKRCPAPRRCTIQDPFQHAAVAAGRICYWLTHPRCLAVARPLSVLGSERFGL